ncbi:tRNA pseudouridine(55) synthase TruB [Patescibacteria group bacterium]|nr:tRNA pseudouridine(55) synthase TruB [Patescibacteria group bacterium]MBU4022898.1 tRNA pseudouridine(55) synthase TruB [Patescibacteria group bacterium]MBU4078498.1 tRNA pseudouridine(55) synthase TruB [Patescibacteria group bacterium]
MNGIAIFYKPKGQTSYDVIRQIKKLLQPKKIGHGGTLDPFAEGVLIIGINEGTKQLTQFLKSSKKEYIGVIELGKESNTFDSEGNLSKYLPKINLPRTLLGKHDIINALNTFKGKTLQTPPKFSAVKISGKPAYKLARQGKEFTIAPKEVEVIDIELLDYNSPELKLKLLVGSGFYVRSFANDLGKKLKTGAYLKSLIRTQVSNFNINQAISMSDLENDFLELCFKAQGRVQGVLFRDTTRRWAKRLGVNGKAENLPNGEIEIIAQGKNKNLDELLEKIKKGPIFSRIDSYNYYFRKPQSKYSKFSIF